MKNKIITIIVTALLTAVVSVVALSLTDSEPLTDWIKMARLQIKGCSNPEAHLKNFKRINGRLCAFGEDNAGVLIREGVRRPQDQSLAPEGITLSPKATEIFVLVSSDDEDGSLEVYEFDLMKIMSDKSARKQIKELIIKTKAQSSDFSSRCSNSH